LDLGLFEGDELGLGEKDGVESGADLGKEEAKRFADQALGAIAVDGPLEGFFGDDDSESSF
jgi:hypothetical protein